MKRQAAVIRAVDTICVHQWQQTPGDLLTWADQGIQAILPPLFDHSWANLERPNIECRREVSEAMDTPAKN